jgi:uncharacterized protein (TIGR02246 family)
MRAIALALLLVAAGKDDDAIKKAHEDFMAAWDTGDAKKVAALYTDDGDSVDPAGMASWGRAEVEKNLTAGFAAPFKGTHLQLTVTHTKMVKPDVAHVDGDFEFTGGQMPPSMRKGHYQVLLVKAKGKWWISSTRAMIPVVPPPPPASKK